MSDCVAVMSGGEIKQSGAPREVYERPRDALVADFLGTANFMDGEVVVTATGLAVRLAGPAGIVRAERLDRFEPGASVRIAFRPEDAAMRTAPEEGAIEANVERINFQGMVSECHVRAGGALLRTLIHPSVSVARGDRVWLVVDPARCVVFAGDVAVR